MLTIYSDDHRLHHGRRELIGNQFISCFGKPSRADMVLDCMKAVGPGGVRAPRDFGLESVHRVYSEGFVRFLQNAWQDWLATSRSHDTLLIVWPTRRLRQTESDNIDGRLGYYSFDTGAPITAGTWQAITSLASVVLSGQSELANDAHPVFSLCRPLSHHIAIGYMGGCCFLNNIVIAVQIFLDRGAEWATILSVDYHHGNDTQGIFYDHADVLFTSIHDDPRFEHPYFLGYADGKGNGVGTGYNFNYPLAAGSDWAAWSQALQVVIRQVQTYAADVLIVSLGVDTLKENPISQFHPDNPDYLCMGEAIDKLDLATLFMIEEGYMVEEIGINAVNML